MAFMTSEQVAMMGFARVGDNVLISSKASFYNCKNIEIGNNVRVDDFCVLSAGKGGIKFGDYIHMAVYSSIIGGGVVQINDFSNISSRVSIYSSSDDFSGMFMTNPMISTEYTNVNVAPVNIGMHCIIGSGSVILPGVSLSDGVAIAALSLVNKDCDSFCIYGGIPCKLIRPRSRELLAKAECFINSREVS